MSLFSEYLHLELIHNLARQKKIKIYLVGGFLRDYFSGRERADFDFAVSKNALGFARAFGRQAKGAFVLLDEDRACARIVKKHDNRLLTFDFAAFRAANLKGDLAHRDFTINALSLDLLKYSSEKPLRNQIVDRHQGLRDLKKKTIRMISTQCFVEDPLRLMRAFSLKAVLGFRIEAKTLARIKKDRPLLKNVSFERVRDELFKILSSPKAAVNLKAMDRIGLLEEVIPQVAIMFGVHQGGYHHLDVWPHSLETVAQLEDVFEEFKNDPNIVAYLNESLAGERKRFALLKLGALLHDIGKPQTRKQEKDRMSFHGHEHVGKSIVRVIAKMLKLSTRERYMLEDAVRWHLRPGYLSNFAVPSRRAIFRYFRDTKEEAVGILLLSLADQRSTRGPMTSEADQKHHEKIVKRLIAEYFEEQTKEVRVRLISGHDLIKRLKLKPSPLFAKILQEVDEQQALGRIKNKNEALALAEKIAKDHK